MADGYANADELLPRRRLRRTVLLSDEDFRDDADVRLPPVTGFHGAVRQRDRAVRVDVRPSLVVHRNTAHKRDDFCFLIELDFLLPEAAFRVGPAEQPLVDGAEAGEMRV